MYEELVKELRDSNCATKGMCGMCPKREKPCIYRYASEAADAIEELQKRVPKTPHGRLIDADALNWVEGRDEQDKPVYLLLKCQCDDIPTIIPAEGYSKQDNHRAEIEMQIAKEEQR